MMIFIEDKAFEYSNMSVILSGAECLDYTFIKMVSIIL